MKITKLLIPLLALFFSSHNIHAQLSSHLVLAPGVYLQDNQNTEFAGWAGFESSLLRVPNQGFAAVSRIGFYYVDLDEDIQGFSVFILGKKQITCDYEPSVYGMIGGGLIYEILEGYDSKDAALKIEIGVDIYRNFSFGVGLDYIPDPVMDDKFFLYGVMDLTPILCEE